MEALKFAIIEDNPEFAHVVQILLNQHSRIFKEVSEFEDSGFDAVFTDLRLRETYGVDTIKALREKTQAPIIVLTGLGGLFLSATDMQTFLDAGADEVFNKEVVTDPNFPTMVKDAIARKAAANAIQDS